MEMNNNKNYAVLMKKQKLENDFFLFLPISLIDGVVSKEEESTCFVTDQEKFFTFNDYKHISQNEYCVGYVIDQETLLEKYPGFSLEDAKDDFFTIVQNATCFGFYLPNLGNIAIFPFEIKELADSLSSISIDNQVNTIQVDIDGVRALPLDMNGLPLSRFELEDEDVDVISEDSLLSVFKKLSNIEDYYTLHQTIEKLYDTELNGNLNEIISSISFFQMAEDAVKESFSSVCVNDLFIKSCNSVLASNDLNEIKDILKKTEDVFLHLSCFFEKYSSTFVEVGAADNYVCQLFSQYDAFLTKSTIPEIHQDISVFKEKEMKNMEEVDVCRQRILQYQKQSEVDIIESDMESKKSSDISMIDVRDAKRFFDERIIGQEDAKIDVISTAYSRQVANSSEEHHAQKICLLIGPTGSGKTLLTQTLAEYLDVPSVIVDTTQLTAAGYVGDNVTDSLLQLIIKANGDVEKAERGIVVFDEIDKKGSSSNSDISGKGALNGLLPYFQGSTYQLVVNKKPVSFHTDKLTIYATGSFEGAKKEKKSSGYQNSGTGFLSKKEEVSDCKLTKTDLDKYGGIPKELLGRISVVSQLHPHTKESMRKVLTDSILSPLHQEAEILSSAGAFLSYDDGFLDSASTQALDLGFGARSLNDIVDNSVKLGRWEILNYPDLYSGIHLTKDTVMDNRQCYLLDYEGNRFLLADILDAKEKTSLIPVPKMKIRR